MNGYLTKRGGVVFTTGLRVVRKRNHFELDPKVIAEPGDIIHIEGDLLSNLTRAAYGDPRVVHKMDDTIVFVETVAS
jgi:hypothetical protein